MGFFFGEFSDSLRAFILSQKFSVVCDSSVPFGLSYVEQLYLYRKLGKSRRDLVSDIFRDKDFVDREKALNSVIIKVKPEFVFLDSFISSDLICLYSCLRGKAIKFMFINSHAMFRSLDLPPSNSTLLPDQKILIKVAWMCRLASARLLNLYRSIWLLGLTSNKRIKRKAREVGLDKFEILDNYPFNIRFAKIHEVILSFKEWEFRGTAFDPYKLYIGFLPNVNRRDVMVETEYSGLVRLLNSQRPIIYISFGTTNLGSEHIHNFVKKILLVANSLSGYNLVISNGGRFRSSGGQKLPENVFFFTTVPQLAILSRASLFITHGGFNSIKEGIYFQVPMIVVPLNGRFDQPGNSSRLVYHGLGLRGSFIEKPGALLAKILFALRSTSIRRNLAKFKKLETSIDVDKFVEQATVERRYFIDWENRTIADRVN